MVDQISIAAGFIMSALLAILIGRKMVVCVLVYALLLICTALIAIKLKSNIGLIPVLGFSLSIIVIYLLSPKAEKLREEYRVPLHSTKGKTHFIEDMNMGVFISGASGSGKSTLLTGIMEHCAKFHFAAVIHDYKDFELTETAGTIFKNETFNIFAIHAPNYSVRINPIDPKYITSENTLRGIVKNFFLNLQGVPHGDTFFRDAAEGLMVSLIWRLRTEFPVLCNLPFVVAILLQIEFLHQYKVPYGNLIDFVTGTADSSIKASTFLSGVVAEKQTAAVYGSLTTALQVLDTPNVMYLLSGSDIDLNITDDANRQILSVVNKPGLDAVCQSPLNAMVIDVIMNLIPRGNKPSAIIMDEAPTVKIYNLETRVSTLRSYGVSFVYGMQDLVQAKTQWGGQDMYVKSTVANLSARLLGKVNDPDTGDYYEKLFALVKEKQRSYSNGGILNSETRSTTSFKDRKKIRGYEFQTLKVGEFVMLSNGVDIKFRFKRKLIEQYKPPVKRMLTDDNVRKYAVDLYALAAEFITGGYQNYPLMAEKFKQLQK